MKRRILAILLVAIMAVTAVVFASCQQKNDADVPGYKADVIRINDTGQFASCIQRIINLKDYLTPYLPEGVSVEWTSISSGSAQRDAIIAGHLDITAMSLIQFLSATENELPLSLISSAAAQSVFLYSNNENIKCFADIDESARIAVTGRATNMEMAFLIRCGEVFGDPMIYYNNIVTMPNTEMLASLATSDEIDCAIIVLPNNVKADEIEGLTMIEDLTPVIVENSLASAFVTDDDFVRDNPALLDAFRKATEDAVNFINENPEEAAKLLAAEYGIDEIHLVNAFKNYPVKLEIKENGYNNTAALLYQIEILKKPALKFSELPNYDTIPKE